MAESQSPEVKAEWSRRFGPTALLCGASEGIGAALAESLAARGVGLVLTARRLAPLEALAQSLRARHGVTVACVAADLGDRAGLDAVIEATLSIEVGLLVYCAAVAPIGEFLSIEAAEHARLVDVNCRAPSQLAHHFGRRMAARGRGGIVLLSSMAATQGAALVAHYAASKAYQRVLAEGLWAELAPRGVDVLVSLAGPTDTPTYRSQRPAVAGARVAEWPPVLPAEQVAEETLAALGHGASVTPGLTQRFASFVMERVLPRSLAVRLVSRSTRRMYAGSR